MPDNNVIYSKVIHRKILFGECDPAGIVYTPRFTGFSLEAVHQVFDDWFEGKGIHVLVELNALLPVKAISHEFIHPVAWGDELAITVKLIRVGQHSLSFELEGQIVKTALADDNTSNDKLAFTAAITLVFVCGRYKTVMKVPSRIRSVLKLVD